MTLTPGKEPFKWDWDVIEDVLDFGLRNKPERLVEATRTKWVVRISGFFRCTSDEKAFFAGLPWQPSNLHYVEAACSMYRRLAEYDQQVLIMAIYDPFNV